MEQDQSLEPAVVQTNEEPHALAQDTPLPQPSMDWLQQAGNVQVEPPPVSPGFAPRQPQVAGHSQRAEKKRVGTLLNRNVSMKAITATGLLGIAVLAYLQFGGSTSEVKDMLGADLIRHLPESTPVNRGDQVPVDPRLADPIPLDMLQLEAASGTTAAAATMQVESWPDQDIGRAELATPSTAPSNVLDEPLEQPLHAATPPVATAPVPTPVTAPAGTAAAPVAYAPVPASGMTNEEVMLRLERLELLLAQLQMQAAAAAKAPQASVATSGPATTAAPATAPAERRVAPTAAPARARMVKAPAATPKPAKQAKAAAPASPPAPALGGQLVSVDMWNGEASVVIASGIPGDRRVRVLRPGDVVNGLALRSADPVTRSATFVAPGSQGLTLYVSQGG
jgi:Meckel syndrome type 1 protein